MPRTGVVRGIWVRRIYLPLLPGWVPLSAQ
jgi:hypothetical protein